MAVLIVIGIAAAVGAVLGFELALRRRASTPLDTEPTERWFVSHAPSRLRGILRAADRRVAGGAATVVVFTVLFLASLAVGWIFDSIDDGSGFAHWDRSVAQWGADHATPDSVRVLDAVTQLGSTTWLLVVMAGVGAVASWRHRRIAELGYLALVGLGVTMLNNGLKWLVHRERPDIARLGSYGGWSFPSGHTAAAAACWAAMAFIAVRRTRRRRVRAIGAAVAATITIAVASTRVLLGVHWLTDVIAGAITGWTWFLLVTVLFGGRILRFGEPAERVAADRVAPAPADRPAVAPVPPEPPLGPAPRPQETAP